MEYSSDEVMTRKEYLKQKKKSKLGFRIIKYVLLLVVIALLGVYLFKQLNIYNNVTKMANKVVEESELIKTMTMYYVAEGYTKDALDSVMLYKSLDQSRTKIEGTEGFANIKLYNEKLYGLENGVLHAIDLLTGAKEKIMEESIKEK